MSVTERDLMAYVGIDDEWADDVQRDQIVADLRTAEAWLVDAVGYAVALDMPQGEQLVRQYAAEAYNTRTLTDERLSKYAGSKVAASLGRMAFDLLAQLRLTCADLMDDERWRDAEESRMLVHRARVLPPLPEEVEPWPEEI